MMLERGRLYGCGVTNPRADRIRQIVDTAGVCPWRCCMCAAIVAAPASWVEFLAQGEDLVLHVAGSPVRARPWTPRPRSQAGFAFGEEPLYQGDHPAAGYPISSGDLALGAALDQNSRHDQLTHPHRSPLDVGCERCPETGVNDVLNSDTTRPTRNAW
jgi:hypothetical protein